MVSYESNWCSDAVQWQKLSCLKLRLVTRLLIICYRSIQRGHGTVQLEHEALSRSVTLLSTQISDCRQAHTRSVGQRSSIVCSKSDNVLQIGAHCLCRMLSGAGCAEVNLKQEQVWQEYITAKLEGFSIAGDGTSINSQNRPEDTKLHVGSGGPLA